MTRRRISSRPDPHEPPRRNDAEPGRDLGPLWVQLHTGHPGVDGRENIVPGLPRASVARSQGYWDSYGLRSMDVAAYWDVPASAHGEARFFTVWNSPVDGRFLATGGLPEPIEMTEIRSLELDSFPDSQINQHG